MRHCTGSKYQLDRSHLKQENINFKIASQILILKCVGSTVANKYAIYACDLRTVEESDEVCFCLCVCVFVCLRMAAFWVRGWWDGVAPLLGSKRRHRCRRERERGREGPLPDPPLTAHAQATCLGTWSGGDCFFEIWKSLRTKIL